MGPGQPHALALADGIAFYPGVLSQDTAVHVDKVPGLGGMPGVLPDKTGIGPVGDEADVLAVWLAAVGKARFPGQGPDGLLVHLPQGEAEVGQLVLGEGVEDIALVLLLGKALFQQPAAPGFVILHPGIVAGDDILGPFFQRLVQQKAELEPGVAADTGVGGVPRQIALGKGIDHFLQKKRPGIPDPVPGPQGCTDGLGIGRVLFAAAAAVIVEPQGDAGDPIPGPDGQQGRGGAVHPAAHGGVYVCHSGFPPLPPVGGKITKKRPWWGAFG